MKKLFVFVAILIVSFIGCSNSKEKNLPGLTVTEISKVGQYDFIKWNDKWYPVQRVSVVDNKKIIEVNIDGLYGKRTFVVNPSEVDSLVLRGYDEPQWQKLACNYISSRGF